MLAHLQADKARQEVKKGDFNFNRRVLFYHVDIRFQQCSDFRHVLLKGEDSFLAGTEGDACALLDILPQWRAGKALCIPSAGDPFR